MQNCKTGDAAPYMVRKFARGEKNDFSKNWGPGLGSGARMDKVCPACGLFQFMHI